jgi:glucose-1-phosphate thymidylyltransferase
VNGPHGILLVEPGRDHGDVPALMPAANRALAAHALDALALAGVRDVVVAAPAAIRPLVRRTLDGSTAGVTLHFAECTSGRLLCTALAASNGRNGGGVLVHRGDCMFRGELAPLASRLAAEQLDALLLKDAGNGSGFAGVQLFGAAGADMIGLVGGELRRDPTVEELAETLLLDGLRVETTNVECCWRYQEEPEAILELNRYLLEDIELDAPAGALTRSVVQGRARIDPTARISRSLIRGPAIIGAGAEISDAYIGPYTSIGPGTILEAVEIEHSVVHADCTIRHMGIRLESSVIGPDARLGRHFDLPKALHLHVGRRARVSLS